MKQRTLSYALFDTALGRCAIAWSERGIVRIQFPESSVAKAVRRLTKSDELTLAEPPPLVARAIAEIERHLAGEPQDFTELELDLSDVPSFHVRVYKGARKIPPGKTMSYGELASFIGAPGAARAVGS